MTTLTIEIPDSVKEDVIRYLVEKNVVIRETAFRSIDDLNESDYKSNLADRSKHMRRIASKYL